MRQSRTVSQTRRPISNGYKEHLGHLKYYEIEKTSIAQNTIENNYNSDISCLISRKYVVNNRKLEAAKILEIIKCKNRVNSYLYLIAPLD